MGCVFIRPGVLEGRQYISHRHLAAERGADRRPIVKAAVFFLGEKEEKEAGGSQPCDSLASSDRQSP